MATLARYPTFPAADHTLAATSVAQTETAALYLAYGSAVAVILSISLSQICLGLGLAVLLLSGRKLRFPPFGLLLTLFVADTVVALLLSGNPHGGIPQIRKFFVFAILLLLSSLFQNVRQVALLLSLWVAAVCLSAGLGFIQLAHRHAEAVAENANNYGFFLDQRMTGFMSHWMTFGGQEMIILLMLTAYILFAKPSRWKLVAIFCAAILAVSVVLGLTRSIFLLGMPTGLAYLVWQWKRWVLLLVPCLGLLGMAANPLIRDRVISAFKPHDGVDSNAHRAVTRAVGWEMVKAHPWFGLGPEQIGPQFSRYIPPSVHRPLPGGWYGHLHNIYLQYAAERGIPGMLLIMSIIGKCLFDFRRALRKPDCSVQSRYILHGAIAVIVAILAEGMFEYNLGDTEVLTLFLTVIACGYVACGSPRMIAHVMK